jgi:hypothetical protein
VHGRVFLGFLRQSGSSVFTETSSSRRTREILKTMYSIRNITFVGLHEGGAVIGVHGSGPRTSDPPARVAGVVSTFPG